MDYIEPLLVRIVNSTTKGGSASIFIKAMAFCYAFTCTLKIKSADTLMADRRSMR